MKQFILLTSLILFGFISYCQSWSIMGSKIIGQEATGSYGKSFVSISGDGNVICGGRRGVNTSGYAKLSILKWDGTDWVERLDNFGASFQGPLSETSFGFNYNGDVLAMAHYGSDVGFLNSGYVRVYEWNYTNNAYQLKGNILYGSASQAFLGRILNITDDGNTIAIQHVSGTGPSFQSHVTIYDYDGSSWVVRGASINIANFNSTFHLSNNGNHLVVGISYSNTFGIEAGLVKVYDWTGTAWVIRGAEIAGQGNYDHFGGQVKISNDGNNLFVYAADDGTGGFAASYGLSRSYTWNGTAWVSKGQNFSFYPSNIYNGGYGKIDMSITGDTIAILEPLYNFTGSYFTGVIDAYSWSGSAWNQISSSILPPSGQKFTPPVLEMSNNGKRIITANPNYDAIPDATVQSHGQIMVYSIDCFPTSSIDEINACISYTWINGITYTASNNTATQVVPNANGCDSTITLNLTINTTTSGTDNISECVSHTWINGVTYTASNNIATHTLTNSAGCDSIVTLNLLIKNPTTGIDTQSICNSYTWINGVTYTSSNNTATHTLINAVGCDSVVTLNLTIKNPTSGVDIETSCSSYTWINGITYTSSNNTATHTLINAVGCDSVVALNLTITNIDDGVTVNGLTLNSNQAGASYQWLDCNNAMQLIVGAVGQSYSPSLPGSYAVEVTNNGCTKTSSCQTILASQVVQNEDQALKVFPNPFYSQISISKVGETIKELRILNAIGQIVHQESELNTQLLKVNLEQLKNGIYLLSIDGEIYKIVKN